MKQTKAEPVIETKYVEAGLDDVMRYYATGYELGAAEVIEVQYTIDTHARRVVFRLMIQNEPHTVDCAACGKPACTVEECPEPGHEHSCELDDGRWVCSAECWNVTAEVFDA